MMSNTIIPIFIPSQRSISNPPKCPNCKKELLGWKSPTKYSDEIFLFKWLISIYLTTCLILGGVGSSFSWSKNPEVECGLWFSKRWHYVAPTYQMGCRAGMWLKGN